MTKPLISILIPACNHADYIGQTLDSIEAQQRQDLEVIVIDDGSRDATYQTALARADRFALPISVHTQPNQGICRTLDRALTLARGEWIAVIASDDWLLPDRFTAQLDWIARHPDTQLVYANGLRFEDGKPRGRIHSPAVIAQLDLPLPALRELLASKTSKWFIQSGLFRRSLLQALDPFDDGTGLDDWPLNIRLFNHFSHRSQYHYVDADVVAYRQHAGNSFRNVAAQTQRKLNVLNRYCPAHLKDAALADACWEGGKSLLLESLRLRPALHPVLRLCARLIGAALKR